MAGGDDQSTAPQADRRGRDMKGYKRKITKRYFDYDKMSWSYSVRCQAVITDNIEKYQKGKRKPFREMDGTLYDWYEFIGDGIGDRYISVEKLYEWEVFINEQQGVL